MGTNDYQKGPRHGASRSGSTGKRSSGASRPRREPLQDNYYYEAPPRGWKEGDAFQDISSYSSPAKRRAEQKAMEEQRRREREAAERRLYESRRNMWDAEKRLKSAEKALAHEDEREEQAKRVRLQEREDKAARRAGGRVKYGADADKQYE